MKVGYLLQYSPQDLKGFSEFFNSCFQVLNQAPEPPWVFLRGDGIYQGLQEQRSEEPGVAVSPDGGWRALLLRGIKLYISQRCACLRGLGEPEFFLEGAQLVELETLAELCLDSTEVVVL